MGENEINSCPFCNCGYRVKLHRNFDYVYCENCGARGSYFDGHPEDAINTWNRVSRNYKIYCGNCKFYLHKGQCKISKELVCIYDKACKNYKRKWWKFWAK